MTPEDKLEKVEELLAARDEITAELLELMGATEDEEIEEEEDEGPAPTKKQRKCSVCGMPGHTAQSCDKNAPAKPGLTSKGKGCPECGSISKHKAICSKSSS